MTFESPFHAHDKASQFCVYVGAVAIVAGALYAYWGCRAIIIGTVTHHPSSGGLENIQSLRVEVYSRSENPVAFWNVVAGRIGFGILGVIFGIGIACFRV